MSSPLTEKQKAALKAVGRPGSAHAFRFWAEARISWPGPRRTLGSLIARGLVDYNPALANTWFITDEGLCVLEEIEKEL